MSVLDGIRANQELTNMIALIAGLALCALTVFYLTKRAARKHRTVLQGLRALQQDLRDPRFNGPGNPSVALARAHPLSVDMVKLAAHREGYEYVMTENSGGGAYQLTFRRLPSTDGPSSGNVR